MRRSKLEETRRAIQAEEEAVREAEARVLAARQERGRAEAALREAEARAGAHRQAVERIDEARRAALDERASREGAFSRVQAQSEVLEQAEQSLAGYAEGAQFLLDAARRSLLAGTRGALSAALDVPAEYETAIASALGEALDAVLLEGPETENALRLLESEAAARAVLLPLEPRINEPNGTAPQDPDYLGSALDLLHVSEELRPAVSALLGQVLIVRDRAAARRILPRLAAPARVVTLQGEVFHTDGRILAGRPARTTTLSRPRQRREYAQTLDDLSRSLHEVDRKLTELSGQLEAARRKLGDAEADAAERRAGLVASQELESRLELERESRARQLEWQGGQLQQLERELLDAAAVQESLTEAQEGIERTAASLLEEGRRLSHSISGVRLDELQQQAAYWTTRVAVAEQAIRGTNHRLEERRIEMGRLEDRLTQLDKRLDEARTASSDLDAGKAELRTQVTDLQSQVDQARAQIEPAERELEQAETEEASLQEKEAAAQKMLANIERSFGQVQLDMTRRQEGLTNLRQRIVDDFGLVLFDYAADVSGPVPLPLEGMVEQLPVVNELPAGMEEQLAQQRAQLRRMGPINPEAKAEFDSESQRYEFMKAQVDDLRKAEADLKQVIAELDELTRREFSRTFDEVDKRFRETFVRLFGGGSARLALTDPENLVETGIEIEARLPGRREQGLALLSGGERSLTAIALVFALLKVSPTPICVMDEVDAMLDEANVGRFRDLLSELSEETQFVIITHNRNTVQAADVIYGITMGRDSASQVISLRLDQVTDEMLSHA